MGACSSTRESLLPGAADRCSHLPDNRVGITAHFLLHGIHHYLPMDRYRLVVPPTLFVVLAAPFWKLAHAIFWYDWFVATTVFCGGIFGYVCYDTTHYFLHHRTYVVARTRARARSADAAVFPPGTGG